VRRRGWVCSRRSWRAGFLRWVVARRVAARRAGWGVAADDVVVAAGVAGRTVVVAAAAGLGAARTTILGLLFDGAGSGLAACEALGAASGLGELWARAGPAVASDAAATIVTQRRCAFAPISTNRTFGRNDRTPGCPALQPLAHPFGW
jgi:hypothetical protein